MMKTLALLLALTTPAFAQSGSPTKQSGSVTPTHAACWTANGIIQDCGTAAIPYLTTIGTVGQGPTICANSGPPTSAFVRFCIAANTSSAAVISVQNYGGASPQNLVFNINGTAYTFPFAIGGIVGPSTSVIGDLACWNNTVGSLLSDCGFAPTHPGGSPGNVQINQSGAFGGITNTQLTALLNPATSSLQGALPAWPGNTTTYFRGDGSYATLNFAAIAGTLSAAQCPVATSSTFGCVEAAPLAAPGGRFVPVSGSSCSGAPQWQINDITSVSTFCLVQMDGSAATLPIGSANVSFTSPLSVKPDSTNHTTGNVYDIFCTSGTVCCIGPAYTSNGSTVGTPAARSAGVTLNTNGFTYNTSTITHCYNNGTDDGPVAGGAGLLMATFAPFGSNGVSQWLLSPAYVNGGTNNCVCLSNFYPNQRSKDITSIEREGTSSWSYSTITLRCENNSCLNAVTVVDGRSDDQFNFWEIMTTAAGTAEANSTIICVDNTSATNGTCGQTSNQVGFAAISGQGQTTPNYGMFPGTSQNSLDTTSLGKHTFYAMEGGGNGGGTQDFFGQGNSGLFVSGRY